MNPKLLVLHQERDDVPSDPAPEAVVDLPLGIDVEGRRLLVVERAARLVVPAGLLRLYALGDHVDDVVRRPDLLDELLRYPASQLHLSSLCRPLRRVCRRCYLSSTIVTPVSPSPHRPRRNDLTEGMVLSTAWVSFAERARALAVDHAQLRYPLHERRADAPLDGVSDLVGRLTPQVQFARTARPRGTSTVISARGRP